jgi:hypothetical protein
MNFPGSNKFFFEKYVLISSYYLLASTSASWAAVDARYDIEGFFPLRTLGFSEVPIQSSDQLLSLLFQGTTAIEEH